MHYAIWYGLTGGALSNDSFTGPFDLVQVVAFFMPYLLLAELWMRWRHGALAPAGLSREIPHRDAPR
jgi:hypothetical protein